MKKYYTLLFAFLFVTSNLSQAQTYIVAPTPTTSTQLRLPNGTAGDKYVRGYYYITQTELGALSTSSPITAIRLKKIFDINNLSGDSLVNGTIQIYMLNIVTQPATLNRGASWATIISGMTSVYNDSFNVAPDTNFLQLNLSTSFNYNGGGMYIAYSYARVGNTINTTSSTTWQASDVLPNSCFVTRSATALPVSLTTTGSAFRPSTYFGFINNDTNNASVDYISSFGKSLQSSGTLIYNNNVSAKISNLGILALTNLLVTFNVTGANTSSQTFTIPNLAVGANQIVNFNYSSYNIGNNTLSINVPTDQNNSNNSKTKLQNINCNISSTYRNEAPVSSIGYNTGSGTLLMRYINSAGNILNIKASSALLANTPASTGKKVFGVLISKLGVELAKSDTVVISTTDLGLTKRFNFATAISVAVNDTVYVGIGQVADAVGFFPVATFTSATYEPGVFAGTALGGGPLTVYSTLGNFMLETNLDSAICNGSFIGFNNLDTDDNNALSIKPNPTNNSAVVSFNLNTEQLISLDLIDNTGKLVSKLHNKNSFGYNQIEINLTNYAKGLYTIKLTTNNQVITKRLIKQ